jgi:hypothetical protein
MYIRDESKLLIMSEQERVKEKDQASRIRENAGEEEKL